MYMVTAGTHQKIHFFEGPERLQTLQGILFEVADAYDWMLQAWAVFPNHYHFIAQSPADARTLKPMIQRLHSQSARVVNTLDKTLGRRIWYQYWDTCITYEQSYYARLNYVHNNAVKHGLVEAAEQYPFCSAIWFKENTEVCFRQKVESIPYKRVNIRDDF